MFELSDVVDLEFPQLSPIGFVADPNSDSPVSSPVSGGSSSSDVVFGSLMVDRNSSTPYTDATQVIRSIAFDSNTHERTHVYSRRKAIQTLYAQRVWPFDRRSTPPPP